MWSLSNVIAKDSILHSSRQLTEFSSISYPIELSRTKFSFISIFFKQGHTYTYTYHTVYTHTHTHTHTHIHIHIRIHHTACTHRSPFKPRKPRTLYLKMASGIVRLDSMDKEVCVSVESVLLLKNTFSASQSSYLASPDWSDTCSVVQMLCSTNAL